MNVLFQYANQFKFLHINTFVLFFFFFFGGGCGVGIFISASSIDLELVYVLLDSVLQPFLHLNIPLTQYLHHTIHCELAWTVRHKT